LGESVFDEIERIKTTTIDPSSPSAKHSTTHSVYFGGTNGRVDTPVYKLENLDPGNKVCGPAVIIDATQTIVLDPRSEAVVTSQHLFITLL
jgi:5-oxoprolinase (ATP-hydrolysing)